MSLGKRKRSTCEYVHDFWGNVCEWIRSHPKEEEPEEDSGHHQQDPNPKEDEHGKDNDPNPKKDDPVKDYSHCRQHTNPKEDRQEEEPDWLVMPCSTTEHAYDLIRYMRTHGRKEMACGDDHSSWSAQYPHNWLIPKTLREFPQIVNTPVLGKTVAVHVLRLLAEHATRESSKLYVASVLDALGEAGAWYTLPPWEDRQPTNLLTVAGNIYPDGAYGITALMALRIHGFVPAVGEILDFLEHCDVDNARLEFLRSSDVVLWSRPHIVPPGTQPAVLQRHLYNDMRLARYNHRERFELLVLTSYAQWRQKHWDLVCAVTRVVWAFRRPEPAHLRGTLHVPMATDVVGTIVSFLSPRVPSITGPEPLEDVEEEDDTEAP